MKKLLFCFIIISGSAIASVANVATEEAAIATAHQIGSSVYAMCIEHIPLSIEEQTACVALYASYVVALGVVNSPNALTSTSSISPYKNSPYDICRYETSHFVFYAGTPYCPAM